MGKVFSNKITGVVAALVVCALWGSLYPFVKIGYSAFCIAPNDIPSIVLFAGIRFTLSGLVLGIPILRKGCSLNHKKIWLPIVLIALTSVVLHYTFTYMALSMGEGSKSAIIKQVGFLFLSCFAFLIVKDDKFSVKKLIAGGLGFLGIIVTNFDGSSFSFSVGDALLILASFCSVISMVVSKKVINDINPVLLVAFSQLIGGIILCFIGLIFGGRVSHIDIKAGLVFAYICFASIIAYCLWNVLIKYNNLSMLAIIKFTEPLFAVIFSGILLGENIYKLNYLIAFVTILLAIILNNYSGTKKVIK